MRVRSKTASQWSNMSERQLLKECGFKDMNEFMLSYGLKIQNHADVQEAKAILDAFREQYVYEATCADERVQETRGRT